MLLVFIVPESETHACKTLLIRGQEPIPKPKLDTNTYNYNKVQAQVVLYVFRCLQYIRAICGKETAASSPQKNETSEAGLRR